MVARTSTRSNFWASSMERLGTSALRRCSWVAQEVPTMAKTRRTMRRLRQESEVMRSFCFRTHARQAKFANSAILHALSNSQHPAAPPGLLHGRGHRLLPECGHLPPAAGHLGEQSEAQLLPLLQIQDSHVAEHSVAELAAAAREMRELRREDFDPLLHGGVAHRRDVLPRVSESQW
jgi:hypothetical protein